jgi:hypothetical protein
VSTKDGYSPNDDQHERQSARQPLFARTTNAKKPPQLRQSLRQDSHAQQRPNTHGPTPKPTSSLFTEAKKRVRHYDDGIPDTRQKAPATPPPPKRPTNAAPRKPPPPPLFDMSSPRNDNQRNGSRPTFRGGQSFLDLEDTPFEQDETFRSAAPRRPPPSIANDSVWREYEETNAMRYQLDYQYARQSPLDMPGDMWIRARSFTERQPIIPLVMVALASIMILVLFVPIGGQAPLSNWLGPLIGLPAPSSESLVTPNDVGNYYLIGAPSLTAEEVDSILVAYNSPAVGTGEAWVSLGKKYGIDPAFAVAFFIHESSAGTHPGWAGLKDDGTTTHNIGNIICAGYPTCYGRFRDYQTWDEGIEDWYDLIDREYIKGRGTETVDDILPIYAPAFENDVNGYSTAVKNMVDSWRIGSMKGRGLTTSTLRPEGNPLQSANTVMTQDYGVGSHAPAHIWGAVDLALDGDNDGTADPSGTAGKPVYATHSGMVITRRNTWPAGNHIWIINLQYKTGYAHLQDFAVQDGQLVQRGDLIGYVGSTGQSSGPHLDYQVWQKQGGQWVNMHPAEFGTLSR